MALQYVSLILDLFDGTGTPVSQGAVTFTPTVQVKDTTDHVVLAQVPVRVQLFSNPTPTVRLLATDNSALNPSGWAWQIAGSYPGAPPSAQYLIAYANGATQHLSDLLPSTSVPQVYTPIPVSGTPSPGQVITATSGTAASWQAPSGGGGGGGIAPPAGDIGGSAGTPTVVATHLSSALPVAQGGTGAATLTAAALLAGNGTSAVQAVGSGTTGQVLTSNGSGTLPTFQAASSGFANPMTTAGDIIIENATPVPARLAVGTSGQVLTVSGGLPSWQAPSGGGGGIAPPAGDIGGTSGAPTVTATHLTSPLPVAQGGTGTTTGLAAKRVTTLTVSSATYTPNCGTTDIALITTPAANFTVASPSGTPSDGQPLMLRILSGTTAYTPSWGAAYSGSTAVPLPSYCTVSATDYLGFAWNAAASRWHLLAYSPGL